MPKVNSSMIYRIEYDEAAQALDITFTSGKTYTYYEVPREIYVEFLDAGSKGQYFNDNIDHQYSYAQVRGRRRG